MMLFNETEGLFCHHAQDEQKNPTQTLFFNPGQIQNSLPAEDALQKGILPQSASRVYVDGNEARILSSENAKLVLIHPELQPVSLDGKAITTAPDSQKSGAVEVTRGWHSISMQNKNSKSDNS